MAVRMIHKKRLLTHTKTRSKTHTKSLNTKAHIPLQRNVEKEKMMMSFADLEEKCFLLCYIFCVCFKEYIFIFMCVIVHVCVSMCYCASLNVSS